MIRKLHQVQLNIHWQSKGSIGTTDCIIEDLHSIFFNAVIPTENPLDKKNLPIQTISSSQIVKSTFGISLYPNKTVRK